ncbi:MAG TPA: DHA2 family efflux MFS transporter permease subunit [Pseudonocardia sp.]|uniref:DHA2 family efflux MFS transporter permease subunit n=1 Tax=Pseudonocardia sp. TaxID=60912 RepID=UPI002B4ACFEB|nr:DHA2 family efflux MFS transporter permease subunit [Pseudonocardia sp.]HLU56172.1 DHA2 family efflux MFS transporter permease subunit [Pseudonocardia sp.]
MTQAAAARAEAPAAAGGGWLLPLLVLLSGMFMSVLDTSIVNVAIPEMQSVFGVTADDIEWIATSYTLVLGVIVPISSWLSNRVGQTRLYIAALVAFAAGSALCGIAWDLESMIAFRVLQAIPGGVLPVVTLSMLYQIVPKEKIGSAMGIYGLGVVVAPAVGPTLGGYLVEYVDWRLIFFINVPVGVLGAIAAVFLLPPFPSRPAGRFDLLGFLTIAVGLSSLLLALSEGQSWGWTAYPTVILIFLGVVCLALFVVIETAVDNPLLDVRVFLVWTYTNSLLLIAVLSVGLFATLFYIPVYLQSARGLGAFEAGLLLMPQAFVMAVLMPIAGQLYDRVGARIPAVAGLLIMTLAGYLMQNLTPVTSQGEIVGLLCLRALGTGLCMMPIMTNGISAVPPAIVGSASAFNNVVQRVSSALGLAALTAFMTIQQAQLGADRAALVNPAVLPAIGQGQAGQVLGTYAVYQQTNVQVYVTALDDVMFLTTLMTGAAVVLALFLRKPSRAAAGGGPAMVD